MPQRLPHVALLIETTRSFTRAELKGVGRYIAANGPWSVYVEMRALDSPPPPWLKNWRGDGIIARSGNQAMIDAIKATGAPAVELRASRLEHAFPFVGVDNHAIGRMVADHFFERGFRNFGICQLRTEAFFEERCQNFIDTVEAAGCQCSVYHPPRGAEKPRSWERQQEELIAWVADLPKPAGVMACTDQLGFWLLDACGRAGVAVPEEIAVVGVENDEAICTMANPPLSSVTFNGQQIGYQAAALLDRMMHSEPVDNRPVLIEPRQIVVRQSSDIVAIEDESVAAAVRYIREHGRQGGLTVGQVASATHISRSTLERRMQAVIGRTPKSEIERVRFNRIKELLAETDMPLSLIARTTGFKHPQYMSEVFRRKFGKTPSEYRSETQG